jgi:hypothetical protein
VLPRIAARCQELGLPRLLVDAGLVDPGARP